MKVTGHKTPSVFDCYHIVSLADLRDLVQKLTGATAGTTGARVVDGNSLTMRFSQHAPVAQLDRASAF